MASAFKARTMLSEAQRRVVETWGQGIAVSAGAGSGKTTTLGEKVRALMERHAQARFAAVSFTEKSAADLREKFAQMLPTLTGHWITTIHGMCGRVLREFPREAGFDGSESVMDEASASVLWERAIEELWMRELPPEVDAALEKLLERERRSSLIDLLGRVRDLEGFGVLQRLESDVGQAGAGHAGAGYGDALVRLSQAVISRYEALKRRSGLLDFGDLEKGAARALQSERVRHFFHQRFDLVLVDEFQDTNPTQAEIVWALARPDASNLCVVGDPKQSIYRFRDADVSVFEESCARLPVRIALSENYRSVPAVLEYANEICGPLFEASSLAFEPLIAKRTAVGESTSPPVVRLDVETPADLARWIERERAVGAKLESFALLLKRIRGNEHWLQALSAAGIPLALSSGGFFWSDPRVRELVALLRWWIDPSNELSGATFLRAPWVGVSDPELDEWLHGAQAPRGLQSFWSSNHRYAQALRPLRGRVVRPAEVLERILDENSETELGVQWLALWHRVEALSEQGHDFRSVILELNRAVESERREREVPPPEGQGQLRVLTVHGSKGLEFERVILIDFSASARARGMPLLYWDRHRGAYLASRDEEGARDSRGKDPIEKAWRALEREREVAESKRVFYVALTRAKNQLVMVCSPREKWPEAEAALQSDDWRAWLEHGPSLPRVQAPDPKPAVTTVEVPAEESSALLAPEAACTRTPLLRRPPRPRILPRHSVTDWTWLAACERAFAWRIHGFGGGSAASTVYWGDEDDEPGGADAALSAREVGTRVHACLAASDWESLRRLESEAAARFSAQRVEQWARSSPLMRPAEPGRRVWNELPFEVRIEPHTVVGAIDRLVCTDRADSSRLWSIIDFKVVTASRSDDDLRHSYGAQLQLYAEAVRALEGRPADSWEGWIIEISPRGVRAVEVPGLERSAESVKVWAEQATREVSRRMEELPRVKARPSHRCALCPSITDCREGRDHLKPSRAPQQRDVDVSQLTLGF